MKDTKYVVFKRDELEKWMSGTPSPGLPSPVPDAVVIRRQDVFAAPAFDVYANAMLCVIEALQKAGNPDEEVCKRLLDTSDYFHAQANISYDTERKLPD